jgi:hypothetical protein
MQLKLQTTESSPKTPLKRANGRISSREIGLLVIWAALYAICLFLPFSQFIGGAGFITFSIVILPIYCKMLKPIPAMLAGVIGMTIAASIGAALVPVYGIFSFVIPLVAGFLGSIAFHYRWGPLLGVGFLTVCGYLYAAYSSGTLLWLVPYAAAIVGGIIASLVHFYKGKGGVWSKASWFIVTGCCIYLTTMIENATMNLGSVFILKLPGPLWTVITPASILERIFALAISFALITALWSRFRGKLSELAYE